MPRLELFFVCFFFSKSKGRGESPYITRWFRKQESKCLGMAKINQELILQWWVCECPWEPHLLKLMKKGQDKNEQVLTVCPTITVRVLSERSFPGVTASCLYCSQTVLWALRLSVLNLHKSSRVTWIYIAFLFLFSRVCFLWSVPSSSLSKDYRLSRLYALKHSSVMFAKSYISDLSCRWWHTPAILSGRRPPFLEWEVWSHPGLTLSQTTTNKQTKMSLARHGSSHL